MWVYGEYYGIRLRHSGVNPSAALACPLTVKHVNKYSQVLLDDVFLWWEPIALDHMHYTCGLRQSSSKVYFEIRTGRHIHSLRKNTNFMSWHLFFLAAQFTNKNLYCQWNDCLLESGVKGAKRCSFSLSDPMQANMLLAVCYYYSRVRCVIEHLASYSNQHHNRAAKNTPLA